MKHPKAQGSDQFIDAKVNTSESSRSPHSVSCCRLSPCPFNLQMSGSAWLLNNIVELELSLGEQGEGLQRG
jgi:hypothetical protein